MVTPAGRPGPPSRAPRGARNRRRCKTFSPGRRSDWVEAGRSPTQETLGRVASGADNAGTGWYCQTARVRLARIRRCTREHQCLTLRKRVAGSNLVDMGRNAARDSRRVAGVNSEAGLRRRWGGHGESLRRSRWRCCRSRAGHQADRSVSSERGNRPGLFRCSCNPRRGVWIGTSSSDGVGTGRRPRSSRGRNDPPRSPGEPEAGPRGPASQQMRDWNAGRT